MSRLVNCLNGFDELVNIKIADNEQISQIIIAVKNELENENKYDIDLHKEIVIDRLTNMGHDLSVINEWVANIE
jgi:hypothetical protein